MAAVSAQAGCQLLSTSFRKETTSAGAGACGDLLESSSQSFVGSARSVARLRGVAQHERPAAAAAQVMTTTTTTSAFLASSFAANLMSSGGLMANVEEEDVKKDDGGEDGDVLESSNELLETINNVLADVVDGQKFLKETGRTKPRPMKRRSLVVCFAMGAIQPYINEVEDRVGSLRRTASTSFARTLRLASQLSVGASKAIESITEEYRKSEAERQQQPAAAEVETTLGNLRRTTSTSLHRAKSLVSQLSIGASRAVNYISEELRRSDGEQPQLASAAA